MTNTTYKNEIHFLDLDEGDATLIVSKECKALIDTGIGHNNEVLNLLKRKGIKRLDYLIITHEDIDHRGEVENIMEDIRIDNFIVNFYDNYDYGINPIRLKEGDSFKCGDNSFKVLNPGHNYNNTNDNSLVLYGKVFDLNILFLADVSKKIEEDICKYDLEVDLIKIAHHGSNSSTSPNLLSKYLPKYGVIESGRNKRFNFPSLDVINRLNSFNITIFRTDLDYSIIYKYKNKKGYFYRLKSQ